MKKRFKFITIILLLGSFLFALTPQKTKAEIDKGPNAIGIIKLDFQHVICEGSAGNHLVKMRQWMKINKNSVLAFYGNYYLHSGGLSNSTIHYSIYDESTGGTTEHTTRWELGGWYGKFFIENNTSNDLYYKVTDFGTPNADADEFDDCIIAYEYPSKDVAKYTGYTYYWADIYGVKNYQEGQTHVLKEGTAMTDRDWLNLIVVTANDNYRTITVNTNYQPKLGDYYVDYTVTGKKSDFTYTKRLNVAVVAVVAPVINGPSTIRMNNSECDGYNVDKFLSNFTASYAGLSYNLSIEEDIAEFYQSIACGGNRNFTVVATFADGKVVKKAVRIEYIDDAIYEFFVKNIVLDKSVYDSMDVLQILNYINSTVSKQTNGRATNVQIISNGYYGNEDRVGSYDVAFTYFIDDVEYTATLRINNNEEKSFDKTLLVPIGVSIGSVALLGLCIIVKNKKRRKES